MTVDKIWEGVFSFDTYEKGGEYSASDISSEPLIARLRKEFGSSGIKWEDRKSAFVGTSVHSRIELWVQSENDFDATNMESEVKVKYKNLSGTIDLVLDGSTVLDFKTGSEKNIQAKIRKPDDWIKQLSIYSYLLSKQRKQSMNTKAYIAWFCVDTGKVGVLELELLTMKEVVKLIKEFMSDMKLEPTDLNRCKLCIQFMHRWCGVRKHCPYWNVEDGVGSEIDDW